MRTMIYDHVLIALAMDPVIPEVHALPKQATVNYRQAARYRLLMEGTHYTSRSLVSHIRLSIWYTIWPAMFASDMNQQ